MVLPEHSIKFTLNDYLSTPGDKRYQLLDGEMILAPSPSERHQTIVARLYMAVYRFVSEQSLGRAWFAPLDVVLSDYDVVQPDIMFVSNTRSDVVTEANIQGPPDLVVEILSRSTEDYDRGYKQVLYGRCGVREYWIVDPDAETVEVLALDQQGLALQATYRPGETLASPVLPGLAVNVDQIFRQPS